MINIADKLRSAHAGLAQIAQKYGRDTNTVQLLAVSKTKPVQMIIDAYDQGQRKFGDNYAAELADKIVQLKHLTDIEWHFIGPIQSNKTKLLANDVNWVHSIDRAKIAQRLNDQRTDNPEPMNVLIQVNVNNEPDKSGVSLEEVAELAKAIGELPRLKLRGLMAIPQKTDQFDAQRQSFAALHHCFSELAAQYEQIDTLSMGMTNDLEAAIAEGTTMVRLGTAIFGPRETKQ